MFVAFDKITGKICCAMIERDLAEAIGYKHFGINSRIAWFPHSYLSAGIDNLTVIRKGNGWDLADNP